ncbi:MAG: MerR family transcriptional regulator, partial [Hyphomicrobiales bacterium]
MNEHTHTRKDTYSMTELRREFDVSARTLRFYEDKGLLHPSRDGQNRIFSYRDRARLKLILRGKRVGFSLAEIREILDLYNLRDGQVTQLRVSLDKGRERIAALELQRHEIDEAIADLTRTCEII